jgi:hypothetical protein
VGSMAGVGTAAEQQRGNDGAAAAWGDGGAGAWGATVLHSYPWRRALRKRRWGNSTKRSGSAGFFFLPREDACHAQKEEEAGDAFPRGMVSVFLRDLFLR